MLMDASLIKQKVRVKLGFDTDFFVSYNLITSRTSDAGMHVSAFEEDSRETLSATMKRSETH